MRASTWCRLFVTLAGVLAAGRGAATAAPAPASPSVRTLIAPNRTEPDIAVSPTDPSTIAIGTNPNYGQVINGVQPDGAFVSHNGGASFASAFLSSPSGFVEYADPSLAFARSGTLFYGYLAETPSYCSAEGRSAILVAASTDGGHSFRRPAVVSITAANDKPFLGVESVPHERAHVFMSWTEFSGLTSTVVVARSGDGGFTFGAPQKLFTSKYDNSGSLPVVGPHHRIYVFWASAADRGLTIPGPASVLYRVSTDDGTHYGPVRRAGPTFSSLPRMANPKSMRNLTLPAVTVTAGGDLYVAWSEVSRNLGGGIVSSDIVLTRSTDAGHTWATPHRVNDVRSHDRFMPAITAFADGSIGLAFYDRRLGPNDLGVYATRVTWGSSVHVAPNVRLNARPSVVDGIDYIKPGSTCLSPGRFFGDYIAVAADGTNSMLATWADATAGPWGQTNIWMRRVQIPQP